MRIAIAEVGQETCSFTPVHTTVDTFRQYGLYEGDDLLLHRSHGQGALHGFLDAARDDKFELTPLPIISAWAGASGPLTADALAFFQAKIVAGLRAIGPIDGFFFNLHGAAAAVNEPDVEGALLDTARSILGPTIPIVAPLDHHANITQRMVSALTGLVGHRTQPHNPYDTGYLAAKMLFAALRGAMRPTMAWHKIPLITHQEQFLTSRGPMKFWFDHARALEQRPGILSISPFPMQCWLDVPEGGWAVVVVTDNNPRLAHELSAEMAAMAWEMREQFWVYESVSVQAAVRHAVAAPSGLVILSDTGDSVFGGATGDSTAILRELLAQNVHQSADQTALLPLVDAEAVAAAFAAGQDSQISLNLGGKLDPLYGKPLPITAVVAALAQGPLAADVIGRTEFDMGRTALLEIGSLKIVASEHVGVGGNHPVVYQRLDINPAQAKMAVLKTASNFQYYREMTSEIIRVDTLGPTMSHLEQFHWQHLPRPIYPLDELREWSPAPPAKEIQP